jgi:Protein of unknown function (DUF4238)
MKAPQSHNHHYVPRWYQKRFLLPGQDKLFYLDLKPETVLGDGFSYTKKALRQVAHASCFCMDDLYAMRFGKQTTDILETRLFGVVDKKGAIAAAHFRYYDDYLADTNDAFKQLVTYMGAQRFRTPHGLDWMKKFYRLSTHTQVLLFMQGLFQAYQTMWMEGVWEIVHARQSPTKFIVSDDPVTFYNRRIIAGGVSYPGGEDIPQTGTRTIFPLGMDSCLIITHLQLVRNPWSNPGENRENARIFDQGIANLTEIQFGRELEEHEVLRINHILKQRATRYVAAADAEWLYPERHLDGIHWTKLDDDWFLLPHLCKVRFSSMTMVGQVDGSVWGVDEYGRAPDHPSFNDEARRSSEFHRFEKSKLAWSTKRFGKSMAHVVNQMREDSMGDREMDYYLRQAGLLPPEETIISADAVPKS